jgi:uncharacterized protein with PIN domain
MNKKLVFVLGVYISCGMENILNAIRPDALWKLSGPNYEDIVWIDTKQTKPTRAEVDKALSDCQVQKTAIDTETRQTISDANNATKTDKERIDAIIKYMGLDK